MVSRLHNSPRLSQSCWFRESFLLSGIWIASWELWGIGHCNLQDHQQCSAAYIAASIQGWVIWLIWLEENCFAHDSQLNLVDWINFSWETWFHGACLSLCWARVSLGISVVVNDVWEQHLRLIGHSKLCTPATLYGRSSCTPCMVGIKIIKSIWPLRWWSPAKKALLSLYWVG